MPSDSLGQQRRRVTTLAWILALSVALLTATVSALMIGSVPVTPADALRIVVSRMVGPPEDPPWSATIEAIVWEVRLPRVVLAVAVGAGLAVCGTALQAMVRNVLAEPYILGISSGASTGAAAAIVLGWGGGILGDHPLQAMAFLGAVAASLVVYGVARASGQLTSIRLLLAGVAVGYALNAMTSFLIFAAGDAEGARSVMFWLLGSLALAEWGTPLLLCGIVVVVTVTLLSARGRTLDVLTLGDETAASLGISPHRTRTVLLLLISLTIGLIVAASGSIGFIGLIIPHLARRAVGVNHGRVIPVAALMGALLMVLADLVARTVLAPQELPIGILTAMLGAPLLLILIRRLHAHRS